MEESFGTGSNHVREKDGLGRAVPAADPCRAPLRIVEIMAEHWKALDATTTRVTTTKPSPATPRTVSTTAWKPCCQAWWARPCRTRHQHSDNFSYTDPVDGSVMSGQGLHPLDDGSRVVVRLSGTGTKGATIRVYLESYVPIAATSTRTSSGLAEMISAINDLAEIQKRTGMNQPTVITQRPGQHIKKPPRVAF